MKLIALSLLLSQAAAIWPAPQSFTNGTSVVWLADDFTVTFNGNDVCAIEVGQIPLVFVRSYYEEDPELFANLQLARRTRPHGGSGYGRGWKGKITGENIVIAAVERAKRTINQDRLVPWKFHPRNTLSKHEPPAQGSPKTYLNRLIITQTEQDTPSTIKPLAGEVYESYELNVEADGTASITAVSSTGILRALETFTQLWYLHSIKRTGYYCNSAPIAIKDAPRFKHRGLNLDLSRNWMPKESVLRQIDAIAWNKFNRLHIHMTDAQSWPMDIPSMPELSREGAYLRGLSYSPQDIKDFHTYAIYRGIEVYIEIDMPGHTSSIAYSHPELITAFRAEPWNYYCNEPPCGALKLNSPAVYNFLEKLWKDVLPRLSTYTAYFHTGGDEVNKQDYMLDDTVKSNDTEVLRPLLQKLVNFNHKKVREAGLTPIVWEEMLLEWELDLGKDVVVQTWMTDEALYNSTKLGYKSLFGNYNFWVRCSSTPSPARS